MDQLDQLTLILIALIGAAGSVMAAWVAHGARQSAKAAQENTRPLSNGWSSDVVSRLQRIEVLIVDHLEDHAEHDLRR